MTGSGKTGLGIGLIEEAAIDGVPVLVDRSQRRPFEPAPDVSRTCSRRSSPRGSTPTKRGCRACRRGVCRTRSHALARGACRVGTDPASASPGCDRPPNSASTRRAVVRPGRCRCCAPSRHRPQRSSPIPSSLAERASAAATSVLTLAGIDAEPLRSREHILLSTLLSEAWRQQRVARPGCAHRAGAGAADAAHRRSRARVVLPRGRSVQAGDGSQSAARRARLCGVARRRSARHRLRCSTPPPASRA